ncbi:unnamed protein product, partial [Symbiodinium sp. CCMP2592]
QEMKSEVIKGLLVGFGLGLPMVSKNSWTESAGDFRALASHCTEHESAIKSQLALELAPDFVQKRENYTKLLRLLTEVSGSKWSIVDEKPPSKSRSKHMKLSSFADIPGLIRHMRVTKSKSVRCGKYLNPE